MISFALPWALVGLVAAALPLLLHLVQRHDAPEVSFPAVRYLEDATRDQQKRLRFRHLLLLILRTLLIVALVLAAAGPTVRRSSFGPHAPSALVLVVDNSAASGAVIDGEPLLGQLTRAANGVLDHAALGDRLWLVAADGIAHAGTVAELRPRIAALASEPLRLDLGRAITTARELIRSSGRRGEVVVVSALQRSALAAASGEGDLLLLRPVAAPPANRGVLELSAGLQPWGPAGGRVTISIASSDTAPVPITLSAGGRVLREVLVTPGVPSVQRVGVQPNGWSTITAVVPPDEFRLDDALSVPLRSAPAPAVE
ncbi:MAG: VWA domain-containing protein, partial [Gemmatimonadota bacterium]